MEQKKQEIGKDYLLYRTICRLPEGLIREIENENKSNTKGLEPDDKGIIKKTLKELKQGSLEPYIKWKEELSDQEKPDILNTFVVYGIKSSDMIAVYRCNAEEVCLFTESRLFICKAGEYEIYYSSIPLDKIQKVENQSYNGPTIFFEDGSSFVLKNFQCKNTIFSFLRIFTKRLTAMKEELYNTVKRKEEAEQKEKRSSILNAAICEVNAKYGKELIIKTKDTADEHEAYMKAHENRKWIYFNGESIVMQGSWIENYVNLKKLHYVKWHDEYPNWIIVGYDDKTEKEITYGSEETEVMYDFYTCYLKNKKI